ncbi:MAG: epimerase [Gemmatales bacterium]|nr:MAG: epimerase [Gemmatales bacterium]
MTPDILLPERIENEEQLDEVMTRPRPILIEFMKTLESPLLILGAGGKMGPTLAILARRAAVAAGTDIDVIAVSRFSDPSARAVLEKHGVRTQSADLLDRDSVKELPDARNVLYLVGLKFGTAENPAPTWAINTLVPANICERFPRSRIVALSTGNVYPLAKVTGPGSREGDPLTPLGEYANAAVARERIFGYFAQKNRTPVILLRLSYAVDLRYGVLVDVTQKVLAEQPIDLTMGYFNCIWQGDANEMIIRSLALADPSIVSLNLTGPRCRLRDVAERIGEMAKKPVRFEGQEADTALLSDTTLMEQRLGRPATDLESVLRWTVHWLQHNGRLLGKPTHFEVRDGRY